MNIEFLEEALNYIDSVTPTYIAQGGCGIFAKELSMHLTSKGIPNKLIILVPDIDAARKLTPKDINEEAAKEVGKRIENTVAFVNGQMDKPHEICVQHVVVLIEGGIYLDNTGIYSWEALKMKRIEVSMEKLDQMIADKDIWNDTFDRSVVPFIHQKMDEVFDKMDTFTPGEFVVDKPIKLTQYTIRHDNPLSKLLSI